MAREIRIAVLASGSGTNLQSLIDGIGEGTVDARIVLLFSNQPDAYALQRARQHGVKTEVLDAGTMEREAYDRQVMRILDAQRPDLLVFAGYMRIVTPAFINHYPDRIINIHPALLPAFPGTHAQFQALNYGVKVTGCTTHFVRAEVDAGPVILQEAVRIEPDDTVESLTARILEKEHEILPKSVQLFAEGRLKIEGRRVHIQPAQSGRAPRA
jgi:phosphoribosylglycinamide formyltransferase-1